MTYQQYQPPMDDPDYPAAQGPFTVWSQVFTKPGEQTFVKITEHPDAKAKAAYIWIFIVGTLSGLINTLIQFIITAASGQVAPQFGNLPGYGVGWLIGVLCAAPLTGLFAVIGFAISTSIVHATARFFGGQGTFDKLAYAFGAIAVPVSLVSALMVPLNVLPFAVYCTVPVALALSIYSLFLEVAAIKAVHRFGWGEAAAALFLPLILLGLLCGVLFLLVMRAAGPSINEILRQIQQGLP